MKKLLMLFAILLAFGAVAGVPDRAVATYASAAKTLSAARGAVAVCENTGTIRFASTGGFIFIR